MIDCRKIGLVAMVCLLGLSVICFAAQDKESGDKAHWGVAAVRSNGDYDTDGGVVMAGNVSAADVASTDDTTVGDDLTVGGIVRITPTALTVTNSQAVTVTDGIYNITAQGQANGYTNTITLANPTTAGDIVILHNLAASSNLVGLADSGNLRLSAAGLLGDDDTITLFAPSTSIWVELSRSNN